MEPPIVAAPVEYDSFGALLRSQRQRAHLSQEELAARSGLSERSIRNLEANRVRVPRASTARLLADALGQAGPEREAFVRACRGDPDPPERVETRSAPGADPARLQGDLPAQLPMDMHGVAGREDQLARRRDRTVLPRAPPRSNGGGPQRPCAVAGLVHRRAPRVACHHRAGRRRFRPPHLAAGVGFDRLSPATWALAGLGRHAALDAAQRPGDRAGRPPGTLRYRPVQRTSPASCPSCCERLKLPGLLPGFLPGRAGSAAITSALIVGREVPDEQERDGKVAAAGPGAGDGSGVVCRPLGGSSVLHERVPTGS
jgi:transcriptional regulator with XRE-family HTH domain